MNRKGFTLIELLAVIVILAIIALIATPAVLNIIEDSRKGAAEASARNIINAAKTYYMQETMNGNEVDTIIDLDENLIKYDGEKVTKGYVAFETNGSTSGKMYISGYCVIVSINNEVESTKVTSEECDVTNNGGHDTSNPTTYKKYNDGDPVYFNPSTGVKCNDTEAISTTGTNEGCMKWYAFLDSEDSNTVKLLLDHDLTTNVSCSNPDAINSSKPDYAESALVMDTFGWKQIVNNVELDLNARLIKAEEINMIAPTDGVHIWEKYKEDNNSWYYFHTGNKNEYKGAAGTNTYGWLFDNTSNCEIYGCNNNGTISNGYWTETMAGTDMIVYINMPWYVSSRGALKVGYIDSTTASIRPVIEVEKSIFE